MQFAELWTELVKGLASFTLGNAIMIAVGAVLIALAILFCGSLLARFLARSVLVGAVNMQIQSARLVSQVMKWLLLIVTYAMSLDHLGVGGDIVKIAFALLFGGVVLALALAVGLGARNVVSRALEAQSKEPPPPEDEAPKHL